MKLSINIDHVATLRNARGEKVPDPIQAARIAEKAGADGIVCHLREDRRHVRDDDVMLLKKSITTKLDLEMAATREIVDIARKIKPDLVTLVPEKRKELTTEGGLDVVQFKTHLYRAIQQLHESDIPVSLFIDPIRKQIETAKAINTDMIEIHTGEYANARTNAERKKQLGRIRKSAVFAKKLGLEVNAGHGLDYSNISPITYIKEITEVSIGHAVIAYAIIVGLEKAVKEMLKLVKAKL